MHELPSHEERDHALDDFFFSIFHIPRSFAEEVAEKLPNHVLGEMWKERLDFFEHNIKKPVDDGEIDIV